MHGQKPTLSDIVLELEELPEQVDLLCHEDFLVDDEEEWQRGDYVVCVGCGHCKENLRLYVRATGDTVRRFHQLLLDGLDILCPTCGRREN